jgi:hypothetical protein
MAKDFLHLLGTRVRRDVEILWRIAPDEIAHATTREIGDVTGCAQAIHERARGRFHRVCWLHGLTSPFTRGLSRLWVAHASRVVAGRFAFGKRSKIQCNTWTS